MGLEARKVALTEKPGVQVIKGFSSIRRKCLDIMMGTTKVGFGSTCK